MGASVASQDLSILSLVMHASLVVQLIMALLLFLSFLSWWHIFSKYFTIRHALRNTDDFEDRFWSGADLNGLYERLRHDNNGQNMEKIFHAGFAEFLKLRQRGSMELSDVMEGTRRAMRAACQRELDHLDAHTSFLASVGSVSPYVGLFGTV